MRVYIPQEGFENYVLALESLGAEVSFTNPECCDALLLPGGGDIASWRYAMVDTACTDVDEERDAAEFEAFRLFLEAKKPIFGICRGHQLINVALGGSLHQDIPGHSRINDCDVLHSCHTDDSILQSIYGREFIINSSHHQAVDRLGQGLKAIQWSDEGVIEALRHESLPIFSVQWHPERLREPTDGWLLLKRWLDSV